MEDLQAGGRLVGVISHVSELKERIAARITVRPAPGGSRVRVAAWTLRDAAKVLQSQDGAGTCGVDRVGVTRAALAVDHGGALAAASRSRR